MFQVLYSFSYFWKDCPALDSLLPNALQLLLLLLLLCKEDFNKEINELFVASAGSKLPLELGPGNGL